MHGNVRLLTLLALGPIALSGASYAEATATFRGASRAVRFDISPPLRSIPPILPIPGLDLEIREGSDEELPPPPNGFQGGGAPMQIVAGPTLIPAPSVSFNSVSNVSGVAPPDPVGDVGPGHYVAMSNLSFEIYTKAGVSVYGPALNNTLWSGFGGACETENSGDPIVLHDQLADRWLLTQFTAGGPEFFNCVALSVTSDPTGQYYRWAFSTGALFPDYPKYGVWPTAYLISTREFNGGSEAGMGAYAVDRLEMLAGKPDPQIIEFFVTHGATPYYIGDGLLPADLDGYTLPPAGSPAFYLNSMDDGHSDGAPQDALNLYEFVIDFANPPASSFTRTAQIPVAAFDTIFDPCGGTRSCIPQPGTANRVDILSYRQRPLHRLAYRNFGTHESLVTNQSVEGAPNIAGIQWWEIRDPAGTPTLFQEGTYVPGATDGIHRWMGSIAMDAAGDMALGFSASDDNSPAGGTFPSVWYTGRLAGDPLGTLPQGEGVVHNGTGAQTGGGQRWGDYTSMNVDPADDCTFWYVNEYLPITSERGWRLRVGAFKYPGCSFSDFYLYPDSYSPSACSTTGGDLQIDVASIGGFANAVTLSASGNPGASTVGFAPNPASPGGSSTMTVGNLGGVPAGIYPIQVQGTAAGSSGHSNSFLLEVIDTAPAATALASPADGETGVAASPQLEWAAVPDADGYQLQVATDSGFTNIVVDESVPETQFIVGALSLGTAYYWRVATENACGSTPSAASGFTTGFQYCREAYLGVPDGSPAGAADLFSVPAMPGNIRDVNIEIRGVHTYVGDLTFEVSHLGTTVAIVDRPGVPASQFGCGNNDFDTILDDEATTPVETTCFAAPSPALAGPLSPNNPLSAFDGLAFAGDWTIRGIDSATPDPGTLIEWCLRVALDGLPFVEDFESANFGAWSLVNP